MVEDVSNALVVIDQTLTQLKTQINDLTSHLSAAKLQHEQLHEEQLQWEQTKSKITSKIKLDVGGTFFTTSLSTLRKYPDSFFGVMFSGRIPVTPSEDGSYFIDRDPLMFPYVLNFMRGQKIVFEELNSREVRLLKEDFDFYLLPLEDALPVSLSPSFTIKGWCWGMMDSCSSNSLCLETDGSKIKDLLFLRKENDLKWSFCRTDSE